MIHQLTDINIKTRKASLTLLEMRMLNASITLERSGREEPDGMLFVFNSLVVVQNCTYVKRPSSGVCKVSVTLCLSFIAMVFKLDSKSQHTPCIVITMLSA